MPRPADSSAAPLDGGGKFKQLVKPAIRTGSVLEIKYRKILRSLLHNHLTAVQE
jgi:hypothetical protein